MKKLSTNALGVFVLGEGKVLDKVLFERKPKDIAEKILKKEDSFCEEEEKLLDKLEGKVGVEVPSRFSEYEGEVKFVEVKGVPSVTEIGSQLGIKKEEILDLNRKVSLELSKGKVREAGRDKILIQSVNTLEELEEDINGLVEHLKELYSLSFPELTEVAEDGREYAKVVAGEKGKKKIKKESVGMEFSREDEEMAKELAREILNLYSTKDSLEEYIEKRAREIAPSTTELVGSFLTAKLISIAGSLKKLALMPSSTIQILGAEKA